MAPAAATTLAHSHSAPASVGALAHAQNCPACPATDPIHRLHAEARAAYQKLPSSQRSEVLRLFKSMDRDSSRSVSRSEVERILDPAVKSVALDCFDVLDADNNGMLNFWETVTLAHILRVPGKLCFECSNLLLHGPVCNVCAADNSCPREEY